MTYAQLRRHLSTVARFGEAGAPTSAFSIRRWIQFRGAGVVTLIAVDRWVLTHLGFTILAQRHMPKGKPARRCHQPRRTPSIGHAQPVHQQQRSA